MKKVWLVLVIPIVLASCGTTPEPQQNQTIQSQGGSTVTLCGSTVTLQNIQPGPFVPTDPQPRGGSTNGCMPR